MANEVGIDFDLFDVAEIFKRTPYIADQPATRRHVYDIGGVPQILKALPRAASCMGIA
jgi:dihydroxy-acid dehydratase